MAGGDPNQQLAQQFLQFYYGNLANPDQLAGLYVSPRSLDLHGWWGEGRLTPALFSRAQQGASSLTFEGQTVTGPQAIVEKWKVDPPPGAASSAVPHTCVPLLREAMQGVAVDPAGLNMDVQPSAMGNGAVCIFVTGKLTVRAQHRTSLSSSAFPLTQENHGCPGHSLGDRPTRCSSLSSYT